MKIIVDPVAVFQGSVTPCGLYARKKWLGDDSPGWVRDFKETVAALKAGQSSNGSWNGSVLETVRRLFGLHLTVRDPCPEVERGLEWLGSVSGRILRIADLDNNQNIRALSFRGLPFVKGEAGRLALGAWLFLCSIFGRAEDPEVVSTYLTFERMGARNIDTWGGISSMGNILRAFVVHPYFSGKRAVAAAVKRLGELQRPDGAWPRPVNFFNTLNALCHLEGPRAASIVKKAFSHAEILRNKDGTWGAVDREWNSFLVVHAMKRKGML